PAGCVRRTRPEFRRSSWKRRRPRRGPAAAERPGGRLMPALQFTGPAGQLEALLDEPAEGRGVAPDGLLHPGPAVAVRAGVVFAHPHTGQGGTMHTKVVYQTAKALSRIGCAVLRFNFRGAGASAGRFDHGPGEMDDFRAALDEMQRRYPSARLWAGGMS